MAKVTFLLGLAGSGKSHEAEILCKKTGAEFVEGTEGDAEKKKLLFQHLLKGRDCIVEEIAYCLPSHREAIVLNLCAVVPGVEIEWVCFENNLERANWNVTHRTNKKDIPGHLHINQCYHGLYIYPGGVCVKPIILINERKTTA
jgi:hypothetical protein